jgi:serine/threonine-protein kinase
MHGAPLDAELVAGAPQPGDVIEGKYKVEKVIGAGGMGFVLAAHHMLLDQRVAVKMMRASVASGADAVPRLLREARASARLQSEHVVRVMDVAVQSNGMPFIVMEYLEGEDLEALLRRQGPLPLDDACDYALQALVALAEAHAHAIVHRDLKPSNLFLTRRMDGSYLVKVLDFGVAKSMAVLGDAGGRLTASGAVMGSPLYMSPEQIRGKRDLDGRSDLWSLGVVLYELLTGDVPFPGDTLGGVFASILESPYRDMRGVRPGMPLELDKLVARCLARRPEDRFATAGDLARALAPFVGLASAARVQRIEQMGSAVPSQPRSGPALAATVVGSPGVGSAPIKPPSTPGPVLAQTGHDPMTTSRLSPVDARPRPRFPLAAGLAGTLLVGGILVLSLRHRSSQNAAASDYTVFTSPPVSDPASPPDPPAALPPPRATADAEVATAEPTRAPVRGPASPPGQKTAPRGAQSTGVAPSRGPGPALRPSSNAATSSPAPPPEIVHGGRE